MRSGADDFGAFDARVSDISARLHSKFSASRDPLVSCDVLREVALYSDSERAARIFSVGPIFSEALYSSSKVRFFKVNEGFLAS